ncbi:MAG: hypothetical protein AMJ43_00080 [Coxiella sp. DG_40]|nr:MAG: hypothetical protein AMJ43_00080 [Coxiella sp. DG_40]
MIMGPFQILDIPDINRDLIMFGTIHHLAIITEAKHNRSRLLATKDKRINNDFFFFGISGFWQGG